MESRKLRVFLCHASEDKPAVRKLCGRLSEDGFDPWLDEERILGGQDWKAVITREVRDSHVVVACLSNTSIRKDGFVQRELKEALDVADEKPEGTISLIPVRLEECEVPDRLSRLHWVDLYAEDGYRNLVQSLEYRAAGLGVITGNDNEPMAVATKKIEADVARQLSSSIPKARAGTSPKEDPPILAFSVFSVPRILRDGGLTELVGDIEMSCTSLQSTGVDDVFDIRVFTSPAQVTNRTLGRFETDAALTTGDEGGIVRGLLLDNPVTGGAGNTRNCLLFPSVRIHVKEPSAPGTVLIRNIRVAAPPESNTSTPTLVFCLIDVRSSSSSPRRITGAAPIAVGVVQGGFDLHMYGPNGERDRPLNFPLPLDFAEPVQSLKFVVSFQACFGGAFRSVEEEAVYGSGVGVGFAGNGTRLCARFRNIPAGFRISVTSAGYVPGGGSVARAMLLNPLSECQQAGQSGASGYVYLNQSGGCAVAEWECIDQNQGGAREEVRFGVRVEAGSLNMHRPETLLQHLPIAIAGCLGPISTMDCGGPDLIPRFRDQGRAFPVVRFVRKS